MLCIEGNPLPLGTRAKARTAAIDALTHLSELLGIDIDAEQLPDLAVLHKAQAVFHLHVVGLEHAHQHQRTFRIDRWLVRRIAVRADGAFEKQLVGPERRKRRREFCAVICD